MCGKYKYIKLIIASLILLPIIFAFASYRQSWDSWVKNLRTEAISQGINSYLFDSLFHNLQPNPRLLRFDKSQPEKRITYRKYQRTRADNYRIKIGRREYRRYQNLLDQVGDHYGVSPCFIVSIWGLESSYGRYMGDFDVIRSLATLAYDGRRSAFFRKELLLALRMLNDGEVAHEDFKGEWAGASGQSQFLPSSFYKYAVDFNGDGRKNIWRTHADIFASIANYLHSNGWQPGQPVLTEVSLPYHFDSSLLTLKLEKTVNEWLRLGVKPKLGQYLPNKNTNASVILPHGGPALMVYNNFKVLMTWNYSSYYAGTVNYMAQNICNNNK